MGEKGGLGECCLTLCLACADVELVHRVHDRIPHRLLAGEDQRPHAPQRGVDRVGQHGQLVPLLAQLGRPRQADLKDSINKQVRLWDQKPTTASSLSSFSPFVPFLSTSHTLSLTYTHIHTPGHPTPLSYPAFPLPPSLPPPRWHRRRLTLWHMASSTTASLVTSTLPPPPAASSLRTSGSAASRHRTKAHPVFDVSGLLGRGQVMRKHIKKERHV